MTVFFKAENALLTDYIHYLFPPEGKGGPCVVRSTHLFGQLLISHCRESGLPVSLPEGEHIIQLRFPRSNATQSLADKFLWFSAGDMQRLNMALKACFDIDLNSYYLKAEGLGFAKKDIIDAFIVSRGLVECDPSDAIHKRIYRKEQAKREKISKMLLRKVYYINEALDTSGLNDIQV